MAFEMRPSGQWGESRCRDWTAREHLAAMAMHGMCAQGSDAPFNDPHAEQAWTHTPDLLAKRAFEIADAMLAESAQREGGGDGE